MEGACAEIFGACAGGAIVTAWALHFNAGPIAIGLLAALPFAGHVLQIPGAWLTHAGGAKPVTVIAVGAARLVWLPLGLLPFLPCDDATKLTVFLGVVGVQSALGVLANNAWTTWMARLVPAPVRGRYLSRRTVYVTIAGTLASLAVGIVLDARDDRGWTGIVLAALAAIACVVGVITVWLLLRQHDPGGAVALPRPSWTAIGAALREPRTRAFVGYLLTWNAAVALSAGFVSYHMLVNLETGFALAALHGVVAAGARIVAAPAWGRLVDRLGARPVLIVTSFGIAAVPAIWFFVTPERLWPLLLEAMVGGALWSGHGIAAFALSLGLAPAPLRPFYTAFHSTAAGVGFAVASMLAGVLAQQAPLGGLPGTGWTTLHALFLLSAVARIGAATLACRIQEPAARGVLDLVRTLGAGLPGRAPAFAPAPGPGLSRRV